jgi:hypothetical protein
MTNSLLNPSAKIFLGIFSVLLLVFALNIPQAAATPAVGGTCPPGTKPTYAEGDTTGVISDCVNINTQYGFNAGNTGTVVISRIINIILGFLGLIALILFIVGGFQWMTSGGNEEKTGGAKKLMVSAIIGLAIVLGAAVISTFAFNAIGRSLGDPSAGDL